MQRKQTWLGGLVLVGCMSLLVFTSGCRGGVSQQPPIHFNWNMDNQKRFDAQEENKFFKDKRAMRTLVPGTVARGFLRADGHLYRGKVNGKWARTLPKSIHLSEKLVRHGQKKYNIFCAPCHGFTGQGNGVVTLYSKAINPANLLDAARKKMPSGQIYDLIANGKMNGNVIAMPSYGSQLSVEDRWAVVAYVRALQLTRHKKTNAKKGAK